MKILIDVNLGPAWVETLTARGHDAIHWSTVGDIRAKDHVIADWARERGYVIFTHDLDFGTLLALTRARGPSVIQVRTQDPLPQAAGAAVISVLDEHGDALAQGTLITIMEQTSRVRILPILP